MTLSRSSGFVIPMDAVCFYGLELFFTTIAVNILYNLFLGSP